MEQLYWGYGDRGDDGDATSALTDVASPSSPPYLHIPSESVPSLMAHRPHGCIDAHTIRVGGERVEEVLVVGLAFPAVCDVRVVRHHREDAAVIIDDRADVRIARLKSALLRATGF